MLSLSHAVLLSKIIFSANVKLRLGIQLLRSFAGLDEITTTFLADGGVWMVEGGPGGVWLVEGGP